MSSLYHLKDSENQNEDAGFFVFPDLSVRTEGSYRLKLSLFEVVGCVFTRYVVDLGFGLTVLGQVECVSLQVDILSAVLCLHREEVPGDGGYDCISPSLPT